MALKINTELILAVWAEGRLQPCFSPSAHLRILSCQLRPRHTPATHGALVTPDRYRCYLPVRQCCNRGCLATPPQRPHPLSSPLSPVKSPRGPDHSKANMWFELASQKPALHTWGCVRNPRARWSGSACVECNCERRANCVCVCVTVFINICQFLWVLKGSTSLLVVVSSHRKSACSVSGDWTKPRTNFKSQVYLVALSHIGSIFCPYCVCFLLSGSAGWTAQQPGGGFGFHQTFICTASQEAEQEGEMNRLVPAIFSFADYLIKFSLRQSIRFFPSLFSPG